MKYPIADFKPTPEGRRMLIAAYNSGMISHRGPHLKMFEAALAAYLSARHVVVCSSGTAALHLALAVVEIGPGDDVVVPDLTYVATANAVTYLHASPVFADVCPKTWNLDVESLGRAVTPKTKAVICVHLLGNPADVKGLEAWCAKRNIALIEDACEALGATVHGQHAGTFGKIGVFSFYANKILTTGEGGALVMADGELADKARWLRDQAGDSEYRHTMIGYNYRMTGLQAALGLAQIPGLPKAMRVRKRNMTAYANNLPAAVVAQSRLPFSSPSGWVVGVKLGGPSSPTRELLKEHGIETRPIFPQVSSFPMYRSQHNSMKRPIGAALAREAVMLPCHPGIDEEGVHFICEKLREAQP